MESRNKITKLEYVKSMIQPSNDFVNKHFNFGQIDVDVLFLKNMVDIQMINNQIIKQLLNSKKDLKQFDVYVEKLKSQKSKALCQYPKGMSYKVKEFEKIDFPQNSFSTYLNDNVLIVADTEFVTNKDKMLDQLMRGNTLIMINQGVECIICSTIKYQDRSINEPPTSVVINGPRAGFIENMSTNISLIRRRICNSDFKVEEHFIGRYTKTKVSICYISSIANKDILNIVRKKLKTIDIDGVIDSQYIVDYLSKRRYSMFKEVGKCEKPDIAVAKMLEGRIAIFVDGSPICLTVPFMYLEDLQSADDYYQKNYKIVFLRYLRLIGSFMAILLPGLYVAMQSYHYKLLPAKFLVTILNSTQGLPLTPFLEILFVIILFEILYESSIRMPKYMGMALSIVGALILGDTAVKAGLVSSPAVMLVALSGITIYTVPEEAGQFSLYRLFFVLLGGTLGLFGITMGMLLIFIYACSIDSFGVPYFSPIAPLIENDLKDSFNKVNQSSMGTRPEVMKTKNKHRMK